MTKRTTVAGALVVVIAAIAAFLLFQNAAHHTKAGTGKVRIAANLPLTGPVAAWSGEFPNGFRLGLEDASKELAIDPAVFVADFQDNAGTPTQAASVAQKQIAAGFDVYISGSSESAKAVVDQIDPLNVPHFIAAFDPFLAAQNPNRLRIMANSKVEAPLFISYAKKRGAKSIYIIHVNSAYANEEFGKIVEPALKSASLTVTDEAYEFDTKDFKTIALKAAQANPDLLFVCGYSFQLRPLLSDLRTNGLVKDGRVMGVMDVVDFLYDGTPKSDLQGLVFACPLFDIPGASPKSALWRQRYQARFKRNPSYVPAYAYDNAWAIVKAYKNSGKVTVETIRAAMPFQGINGEINLDREGDIIATVGLARLSQAGVVERID
jgi:branched-chain amino acid transport system substrate-binding protein